MSEFFAQNEQLVSALIATLTTLVVIFGKEYLDRLKERKDRKKEQVDAFKVYGYPLIDAAESLMYRLKEMFEKGSRFLLENTTAIEFYRYRYVSTLYRLCAVLGWLTAMRQELTGIEVKGNHENQAMEDAISAFQDTLSSKMTGQENALSYLASKWGLDLSKCDIADLRQLEIDIELAIEEAMDGEAIDPRHPVSQEKQIELLQIASRLITQKTGEPTVSDERLEAYRSTCIMVLSRSVCWIYRDWQKAIGDVMLVETENPLATRRFGVMNFRTFEEDFLDYQESRGEEGNADKHRWLSRIDKLFYNLNVDKDDKIDARVQQLRNVTSALLALIKAIRKAGIGEEVVTNAEVLAMDTFDRKNNPSFYS